MPDPAAAKCFHSLPCSSLRSVNVYETFHCRAPPDLPQGYTRWRPQAAVLSFIFFSSLAHCNPRRSGRVTPSCLGFSCHQIRPESLSHLLILSIFKVFPSLSNAYRAAHLSLSPPGTAEGPLLTLRARGDSIPPGWCFGLKL